MSYPFSVSGLSALVDIASSHVDMCIHVLLED